MLKFLSQATKDRFGSKRGLLNFVWFKMLTKLGVYAKYSEVDWTRIERYVFVCHGNICRSPLAEAVARSAGANAVSLGIECCDGSLADARAIEFANSIGIDMNGHRSQSLKNFSVNPSDLLVLMEPAHIHHFKSFAAAGAQLTLAGLWEPSACAYIHDPYSSSELFFPRCEHRVAVASRSLASFKK